MPPIKGMGSEDGGEWGGGGWRGRGWQGISQAIPSVAPPVSTKAPSSNVGVVQAQSCLSEGRSHQLYLGAEEGWTMV